MITRLLSSDLPGSRWLTLQLLACVAVLFAAPWLFTGSTGLDVCARILVFIVLVASYDLILGYTGIVSFAHVMFCGIGAYAVGLACANFNAAPWALACAVLAALAALLCSALLSLAIGLFSLRVKAIFFAMITLAVATAFQTLVSQASELTGGEDGFSFRTPALLNSPLALFGSGPAGLVVEGRTVTYGLLLATACAVFLLLLRIVNSPFGRVLQAIRENEFRALAMGFQTTAYRVAANTLASLAATLAGAMLALWLRYVGPDTALSLELMVDVTLILVIGGMGTMYGAVVASVGFVLAQNYLQAILKAAAAQVAGVPVLSVVVSPDRWLFWLGLLFILSVYHFPNGLVGRLRAGRKATP